ncbi:DUF6449 domain-containing protein [Bacillus rubiinfantis]|uniref:DUF6449 domain-containing protein n=1 Tax=Bacillus rubiinfantis TaxID=1499680 RepID=UPI0005A5DE11|nr:DUF6449 domain-containing protein [Bacillus rubiinfantis]
MPSKMSSFNKEIMKQIGRSTGWISIVYFLGLLFIVPIRLLMMYSEERLPEDGAIDRYALFQLDFELQLGLLVIVPVILAVFLFRFLHVKQAADLMHSLPLKREKIFHHYALTGVALLITPVIGTSCIILALHALLDFSTVFRLGDVFYWTSTTIIISLLLYTASVMIAMLTGISVVHAVLSYIFLFFPVGMILLLFYNLKKLLYGFPSDFLLHRQLEKMSPITFATLLNGNVFQWQDAGAYLLLSLIFYFLALFLYRKRNVEQAAEAIAFPKLRSIFRYGVTFCTMLTGGTYFSGMSNDNLTWTIFGYLVGAVLGYFIAEMVLQKTWRVFGRIKGLIIYAAVVTVLIIGVKALGIYENNIPEAAEIQSVQLSNDPYAYFSGDDQYKEYYTVKPLKQTNNIAAVRRLHKQILADRDLRQPKDKQLMDLLFRYKLENGKSITREYSVNQRLYDDLFQPIYESKEYKLASKPVFKIKEEKIKLINVQANGPLSKQMSISNPEEIREVLAALKKDILVESYKDGQYYQDRGSRIDLIMRNGDFINLSEIKPTYQHVINWFKEKKLLDRASVTADDFSQVLVVKTDLSDFDDSDKSKQELEAKRNSLKLTDKTQMQQLLDSASAGYSKEYKVIFYYKIGGYYEIMSFDEEHAPDFVKQHY